MNVSVYAVGSALSFPYLSISFNLIEWEIEKEFATGFGSLHLCSRSMAMSLNHPSLRGPDH